MHNYGSSVPSIGNIAFSRIYSQWHQAGQCDAWQEPECFIDWPWVHYTVHGHKEWRAFETIKA